MNTHGYDPTEPIMPINGKGCWIVLFMAILSWMFIIFVIAKIIDIVALVR